MAVPKGKVSRQRRDKRRSSHWKLDLPNVSKCPKCGEPVLSHRACKACGTYRGRQVVTVAEAN
jgi:large subunit ribosomal protein L32